jgi:hypothetical protein
MAYFIKEFKYSGNSFSEMTSPSELNSAIGSLAANFSLLDDEISSALICVLGISIQKGLALASEMSFRAKLNVFSALMGAELRVGGGMSFSSEDLEDLVAMCVKSEEFRNRLLHSSWIHDHAKREIRRRKLATKISTGFKHTEEPLTPGQILDIADYVVYTAVSVDEFILNCFPEFKKPLEQVIYA